jgi:hypothetical protein
MTNAEAVVNESPEGSMFISYARDDEVFALGLAEDLTKAGKNVWIDQAKLRVGDIFGEEIRKQLLDASEIVVIMSPAATQSRWVMGEVAFVGEGKRIIPALHRKCAIPPPLNTYQAVDFTSSFRYQDSFNELLGHLKKSPFTLPWRRRYRFLLYNNIVGLIAVIAILIALAVYLPWRLSHSETLATLSETDDPNVVSLQLQNRGGRAATIVGGYRLKFGDLPIIDAPLDLAEAPPPDEVSGHSTRTIALTSNAGFEPTMPLKAKEIEKLLPGHEIILEANIQETGDPVLGRPFHVRQARIPAKRIGTFITSHLPNIVGVKHVQ